MNIFSSITAFILSIFTYFASTMTHSFVSPIPEIVQDDFIPVMRFVATSDTHIQKLGDTGCQRISAMMKTVYALSDADKDYNKLDAVVFSGDITDNGYASSFYAFAAVTDTEIRKDTERLAVVSKAHDSYTFLNNSLKLFTGITGQETDFHRVIGGFHYRHFTLKNTQALYRRPGKRA